MWVVRSCVVRPGRVGADVWKVRLAASEPFMGFGAASQGNRVAVVNTVSQRLWFEPVRYLQYALIILTLLFSKGFHV